MVSCLFVPLANTHPRTVAAKSLDDVVSRLLSESMDALPLMTRSTLNPTKVCLVELLYHCHATQ